MMWRKLIISLAPRPATSPEPHGNTGRFPLFALVLLILLGLGFYTCTSLDDVFLTYWPARTMETHAQILNYNGEHLEQSSSLLHVMLLAGLAKVTRLRLPILGYYVAFLFGLLTLMATCRLASHLSEAHAGPACAMLLAVAPYFVYYSVNSLEATLTAFLVVLLLISIERHLSNGKSPGYLFVSVICFLLVRPEAFLLLLVPVFALLLVLMIFSSRPRTPEYLLLRRRMLMILALTGCLQLVICGIRYLYFGDYMPQTVRAKISNISLERLRNGLLYLFGRTTILGRDNAVLIWSSFFGLMVIAVLMIGALAFLKHLRRQDGILPPMLFPFVFSASYLAYVVFVGGDWMESGRVLVPVLPAVFLLLSVQISRYFPVKKRLETSIPILLLAAFSVLGNYYYATRVSRGGPLVAYGTTATQSDPDVVKLLSSYSWVETVSRGHLRDIPVIEALLHVIASQPPSHQLSLMSHQGGMVNFYIAERFFGRVEFVDLAGLFSRHISSCPEIIDRARFQTPFNSGTIIPWDFYFSHRDELQRACGITPPDIIVDLYFDEAIFRLLEQNGYVVIFKSLGYIRGHTFLGNNYGPATEYIALKKNLVPAGGAYPIVWDWDQKWH